MLSRRKLLAVVSAGAIGGGVAAATDGPDRPDALEDDCPDYGDDVATTACNDHQRVGVSLEPSTTTLSAPGSIAFTLRNRTHRRFKVNWYDWNLHKLVDGDWFYLGPRLVPMPLHPIHPGGSMTWTIAVQPDGSGDGEIEDEIVREHLGSGIYAFGVDGWSSDGSSDARTALIETFELEAPELSLEPSKAVEVVEWDESKDGEELVARTDRAGKADQPTAYELEVADSSESAERVILEQVCRDEQFLTVVALAKAHDADRVRLEDDPVRAVPASASRFPGVYEHDGTTYRLETRES
ncbi:hypothetical protein [Natronobacterium gregoryi]|uniref:Uncharacterized protein n=2 Tax=Natronobacterium gregoryi TaxID=44930 RepID=L0AHD5_NATGS|nr:hypothetical protein [Natronobacterium gregoryi]AFZ73313.1 hypothetical protein Natgr_2132 [Natronobacterium gregoryi SP2]ELY73876.1 hypothetical protein C490_00910 [Natronobacterium gregoryi SP2]PLK19895.1 hypothetical protein CYV19_12345 [Natronobacterium gregoryi SP2]SFJ37603.1 hypothetical protein SAMN05443661_12521 [Natronobacterium gregoryi]